MRKTISAFAAAFALPLAAQALSQAPARIDLDQYRPLAGSWSYRPISGGSETIFFATGGAQRLIVRCNRVTRTVSIVRTAVPAAAPALSLWTSSNARSVPARFEASGSLTADLSARDSLLDAIAFSRGRFATAAAGAPMITVPTSPEPARVIEDCRT